MSKQKMIVAVLALVLVFSAMAFAVSPAAAWSPADGRAVTRWRTFREFRPFYIPYCPMPDTSGCGGGG